MKGTNCARKEKLAGRSVSANTDCINKTFFERESTFNLTKQNRFRGLHVAADTHNLVTVESKWKQKFSD